MSVKRRASFASTLTWIALLLHGLWITVFGVIVWLGPSGRTIVLGGREIWVPRCDTCVHVRDSIQTAAQMGHLDLIAVSLTVLGVVLALLAFGGFFMVRNATVQAAQDEASERIEKRLPEMIGPDVVAQALQNNRWIFENAVKRAEDAQIDDVEADEIARAFDGEPS